MDHHKGTPYFGVYWSRKKREIGKERWREKLIIVVSDVKKKKQRYRKKM